MVPYAVHDGDPLAMFKLDEFSARIREDFKKGGLFEGLIEKHLIKNSHFLRLLYTPDPRKADKEEAVDKSNLESLNLALSAAEKATILEETK